MGYTIRYDKKGMPGNKRKRLYWILLCVAVLTAVLLTKFDQIRYLLLPGDPQVTELALEVFARQIAEGENFMDAFTSFCRYVLEAA